MAINRPAAATPLRCIGAATPLAHLPTSGAIPAARKMTPHPYRVLDLGGG
jgi:hypothetical protein